MSRADSQPGIGLGRRLAELSSLWLVAAAFGLIQVLIGGTRLLFSLPAYGLLAIAGILTVFILRRPKPEPSQICLISAALFFGYILVRALFSPVDYIARPDIYSVLGGLVVYLLVATVITDPKQRMWLLLFLLALAVVHVAIGAVQFRFGQNFMLIPFLQRYDYGRRASGFYVCPNHLAGLLEVLGIFGLSVVCWSRWPVWAKLLIAYAVGICYLGLILTGSRGGYLSTTASILVFALLSLVILRRASKSLFWKVGGLSLVVALVIGAAVFFSVRKSDYLTGRAQNVFETSNMRIDLWKAAHEQWKLRPLWGTGAETYLYYGRFFRTDRMQMDPVKVHNDYIQLLAEYGLVGVGLFGVFLGIHLWNGWRNFQRLGPKRVAVSRNLASNGMALIIGAIAAVASYIIHSIFDFNLHIPANVLLLAFVFGILANPGRAREDLPQAPKSLVLWRLALPLIGLVLIIQCARLLPGEYFAERSRTALRDGQPLSAIFFAVRGLEVEKNNPNLFDYLGSARIEHGDSMSDPSARESFYLSAITAFQNGHALSPQDQNFSVELGFAYDGLGRFAEAEWMFNEALALDPKSVSIKKYYEAHLEQWRSGKTQITN